MKNKKIDLSDIKEFDLDKTSSFTDLMSRSERRQKKLKKEETFIESNNNDIEDMIDERKKSTKDLSLELEKAKNEYKKEINNTEDLGKTQILELTRQMKFNFEETKKENIEKKKNGVSLLNIVGILNLICIGFYIYLLVFTNYQDKEVNYLITGGIIVLLVLLFGISVVTPRKASNFFKVLNILAIISFIAFNIYILI